MNLTIDIGNTLIKMAVFDGGEIVEKLLAEECDTKLLDGLLARWPGMSLLEAQLKTGRTHQIRVHMAYIGHPVAGDPLYGPRKTLKGHGQFLHAKTLGFTHPTTGELVEFTAEEPAIFKETLEKLREA